VLAIFRALLPAADRDELSEELAAEYAERARRRGRIAAQRWVWWQLLASLPALARRAWFRGTTGFEPPAHRLQTGGPMVESWIIDARYSVRRLIGRPTYAALAVLTLAIGAGGTAAIFSVVRALLLDPLPVTREAELDVFWMPGDWTEEEFLHLRSSPVPGFERLAAIRPLDATLAMPGEPLRLVRGVGTTAELFDVLGAAALHGRTFASGEDLPGAEPVAVISHGLWRELGGDIALVGRRLQLGGVSRTIVGVMPPGFWFPSPTTRVWTPMPLSAAHRSGNYAIVGRRTAGLSPAQMAGPLQAIARSLGSRFRYPPAWDKTRAPRLVPLREHLVGDVRAGLLATFGAMTLILLIACVNVTALMLGQVGGRSSELSVRVALGAGRQRLLQQLLIEALVLGAAAGLAGAAFAAGGFRLLVRSLPLGALAESARLDWTVFWAATMVALLAATLTAAIPATVLWRRNLQGAMAGGARTSGISTRGGRLEGSLVVAQIALAVLLAAGAGLLIRSVANLRDIDPGVRTTGVAVIDVTMPIELDNDQRRRAVLDVLPALQALPAIRGAAATLKLPLRGAGQDWGIGIEGRPDLERSTTYFRIVSRDYFAVMGMPIERGRGFQAGDGERTERVVVINEALAAKYFPGEDPIGRIVHTGFDERGERVVGVVGDALEASLTDGPRPARYMLYEQVPLMWHEAAFVLHADGDAALPAVLHAARTALERAGRQLAIQQTTTMGLVFERALGPPGQLVRLLSLLASLALLLGAVGVYGMISHYVTRRTREYGIRLALGLLPRRVAGQVVWRGVRLVAAGSALGVIAALLLTRLLSSLLYGVRATDALTLAGAVATLFVVGSLAALVPARRAGRIDPSTVLRES
jgi:predicted permease